MPHAAFAAALALALSAAPAARADATDWRVVDALSTIEFHYVANDVPNVGVFPEFRGVGRFDPEAPEESSLELEIRIAAVDLGSALPSLFARGEDWFAAAAHPFGRFRLTRMEPLGGGRWRAEGELTVRGVTRPVEAELELELGPERARAVGETMIDRREFGFGSGVGGVLVRVENDIVVRFDLVALAGPH